MAFAREDVTSTNIAGKWLGNFLRVKMYKGRVMRIYGNVSMKLWDSDSQVSLLCLIMFSCYIQLVLLIPPSNIRCKKHILTQANGQKCDILHNTNILLQFRPSLGWWKVGHFSAQNILETKVEIVPGRKIAKRHKIYHEAHSHS